MGILLPTFVFSIVLFIYFAYRKTVYGTWCEKSSTTIANNNEAILGDTTF